MMSHDKRDEVIKELFESLLDVKYPSRHQFFVKIINERW